jgi:hypothetical protein
MPIRWTLWDRSSMRSNINRALIFQGGGSLGAYETGAYKAINEDSLEHIRTKGRDKIALVSYYVWNFDRCDKRYYFKQDI